METKSDDERIVVNGGCFPLHWVRKFYNIETDDIKNGAVTEDKLNEELANKIEQAIANLQLAWDATSGKVTVTHTNGESEVYTLAPATTGKAGIMSAEDKGKVENAVKDVTLATTANSMSLTMTKSGEAASTVVNIPIVSDSVAGIMSAEMLQALKTAFYIIGGVRSKDDVTIQLTDLAGITHGYVIKAVSTTYAGVMSAEDKIKLDGIEVGAEVNLDAIKSIAIKEGVEKVVLQTTMTHGTQLELTLPEATTASDGVMSATDKSNLDESVHDVSTVADQNVITLTLSKNNGDAPKVELPSATDKTAGVMTSAQVNALQELQNEVFPLTVGVSLDKTLVEHTGSSIAVTASYNIKRKGELVMPTTATYTLDGNTKELPPAPSATVAFNVTDEGSKTISMTATYGALTASGSASVRVVAPIYCGFGTGVGIATTTNKLSVRTSAVGTYNKTNDTGATNNLVILVPKSIGILSVFSMGGAPFVMESSAVTINGVNYTMYKSGSTFPNGTMVTVQAS